MVRFMGTSEVRDGHHRGDGRPKRQWAKLPTEGGGRPRLRFWILVVCGASVSVLLRRQWWEYPSDHEALELEA
jgi:hypothetical protein